MANTKNLNLKLPSQDDFYNVDDFNENFQKIDDFVDQTIPISHYNVSATSNDGVTYNATIDGLIRPFPGLIITIVPNMTSTTTKVVLTINGTSSGGIYHQSVGDTGTTQTPPKNDWLRANRAVQLMYNGAVWITTKTVPNAHDINGTFGIEQGGTGATTKENALVNLGLNNVPNVATNDQTPTYSTASSLETLTSGEKLSVAFGKIKKAISDFITHKSSTVHITSDERTAWNGKAPGEHGLGGTAFSANLTANAVPEKGCGFYRVSSDNNSDPTDFKSIWMNLIQMTTTNGLGMQIAPFYDLVENRSELYFRSIHGNTPKDWKKLIHSGNIDDYMKIQSGSYVGTGTHGEDKPSILTFDFVPKIVLISGEDANTTFCIPWLYGVKKGYVSNYNNGLFYSELTWNENTLSWFVKKGTSNAYPAYQLNESKTTYYWVAIG